MTTSNIILQQGYDPLAHKNFATRMIRNYPYFTLQAFER